MPAGLLHYFITIHIREKTEAESVEIINCINSNISGLHAVSRKIDRGKPAFGNSVTYTILETLLSGGTQSRTLSRYQNE